VDIIPGYSSKPAQPGHRVDWLNIDQGFAFGDVINHLNRQGALLEPTRQKSGLRPEVRLVQSNSPVPSAWEHRLVVRVPDQLDTNQPGHSTQSRSAGQAKSRPCQRTPRMSCCRPAGQVLL